MKIENITTGDNISFQIRYELGLPSKPCIVLFHPDPSVGGNMQNVAVKTLFDLFAKYGFSVIRMNLPEIKIQNKKQKPTITLHIKIANATLQWFKNKYSYGGAFWCAGVGYGSRIAMQILMRNPEVLHVILVDPYIHFSDVNHVPIDNIVATIFFGAEDTTLSKEYLSSLFLFLRQKKSLYLNTIGITNTKQLSSQDGVKRMSLAVESFLNGFRP